MSLNKEFASNPVYLEGIGDRTTALEDWRSLTKVEDNYQMKKLNYRVLSILLVPIVALTIFFFFPSSKIFSSQNATDLDYFKGNWTVKMRNNPAQSFSWTVKDGLDGSWLNGIVEQNGNSISTDFWRQSETKIERFAFTGKSVFVRIESQGWEGNKMILSGIMSDKSGETKIRETITKISENQFNALWEMENADGKWTVFGDEICIK